MKNAELRQLIGEKFGEAVVWSEKDDTVMTAEKDCLLPLMRCLKEQDYGFLADITAVDYRDHFAMVYQLYQFLGDGHLTVRVELNHDCPEVESLCSLWDAANWLEREALDLMGITFLNHPDPRRILLWDGYDGHPLRKDYVHHPSVYQGRRSIRK